MKIGKILASIVFLLFTVMIVFNVFAAVKYWGAEQLVAIDSFFACDKNVTDFFCNLDDTGGAVTTPGYGDSSITEIKLAFEILSQFEAVTRYEFPKYGNAVEWNYKNFRGAQDSVKTCYWVDSTTYQNYQEFFADTTTEDSQYVFLCFEFYAHRNVSAITDTLIKFEYWCSVADTHTVGMKLLVYQGTAKLYEESALTATTSKTFKVIRKTYGTLTNITVGERFLVIAMMKLEDDNQVAHPWIRTGLVVNKWD